MGKPATTAIVSAWDRSETQKSAHSVTLPQFVTYKTSQEKWAFELRWGNNRPKDLPRAL